MAKVAHVALGVQGDPQDWADVSRGPGPAPLRDEPRIYWLWIPKGLANHDLGSPASHSEIRCLGHTARSLRRAPLPTPLSKTYAEALMARDRDCGDDGDHIRRQKRSREDDEYSPEGHH